MKSQRGEAPLNDHQHHLDVSKQNISVHSVQFASHCKRMTCKGYNATNLSISIYWKIEFFFFV